MFEGDDALTMPKGSPSGLVSSTDPGFVQWLVHVVAAMLAFAGIGVCAGDHHHIIGGWWRCGAGGVLKGARLERRTGLVTTTP